MKTTLGPDTFVNIPGRSQQGIGRFNPTDFYSNQFPFRQAHGLAPFGFPLSLFQNNEQGAWYDPSDMSSMFQDSAGTIAAVIGQPVGKIKDKSGRGNHASQATAANRPTLLQDSSGLNFLFFDGVQTGLVTGNINFTATDKMSVFAGFTKSNDAAIGVVCELGPDAGATDGSFYIVSPGGVATANIGFATRGTLAGANINPAGVAAPLTLVTSVAFDNAGNGVGASAQIRPRYNGVIQASGGATSPGNYGNLPLNIGKRNSVGLPLSGRIYSLIVRGAASSAQEISEAETYVGGHTGIAL